MCKIHPPVKIITGVGAEESANCTCGFQPGFTAGVSFPAPQNQLAEKHQKCSEVQEQSDAEHRSTNEAWPDGNAYIQELMTTSQETNTRTLRAGLGWNKERTVNGFL